MCVKHDKHNLIPKCLPVILRWRRGVAMSRILVTLILLTTVAPLCHGSNMLKNSNFSDGLAGWELYGRDQAKIRLGTGEGPNGSNCAILPAAHASISQNVVLKPRCVYLLQIVFRRSTPAVRGHLVVFLNTARGANASAGVINLDFPKDSKPASGWEEFREAFEATPLTFKGKLVFSAIGFGEIAFARIELNEIARSEWQKPLLPNADWTQLKRTRTRAPLFHELLSASPGGYTVVAWTHNLNKKNLPADMANKYSDEEWKNEQMRMFKEAGEAGLNYYGLPGYAEVAEEVYRQFGVKFDVGCEWSNVRGNAIKAGAEILNPKKSASFSVDPSVSLVDPHYVQAAVEQIKKLAATFAGKPYVFAYVGHDEPDIALPEGPVSDWGPFAKKCAQEVIQYYGFGKYAMPAPGDPEYADDKANHPFRWIAYNRWMASKYAESKKAMYEALKAIDPNARYDPCDYWFMSGFVPYDFALMGKYSDIVECDPYASSAERRKGRGLYNHGFGAKFLRDITGKPVRTIVQAFDYAGYDMSPDDLLEWVSQSLRAGASHISYYQMDNPRFTHPDRWKMMLHIARTVTSMNTLKIPDDPEVAILYSADSHRSTGPSTMADEIYTAYALLGERVGSWFEFVDDDSLARGERKLSKYRAIYIPFGMYQRESIVRQIERFVADGGVVISGDPLVFTWDINGKNLSFHRERLFGVRTIEPKHQDMVLVSKNEWTGEARQLPIYRPVGEGGWPEDNGWIVKICRPDVEVLAQFPDGNPAITIRKYGRGKAIYFAANPFVPECLFEGTKWDALFRQFQMHLGAKVDREIWHFRLPPPP